jgi:hypothetical protein
MLAAGLPLFALAVLFGGISFGQVGRVLVVTVVAALAAGSLGSTLAFWREKTFQTLAMTALTLVFWLGIWEAVATGLLGQQFAGITCETWATGFSPVRAILAATRSHSVSDPALGPLKNPVNLFLLCMLGLTALLNMVAIARVRVWNPSRELYPATPDPSEPDESTASAGAQASDVAGREMAEAARAAHVDARLRQATRGKNSREVWDNPILWREMCTRAYGHKVTVIRLAYLALFVFVALALYRTTAGPDPMAYAGQWRSIMPAGAKPLAPFFFVSLVLVNALAVTSITTERDGRCLDLLLVSDISPAEFIFGKLGGVLWVAKEMVLCPVLLALGLWWAGGMSFDSLLYVLGGLIVMNSFVATLGIHCGMSYANSRSAISVSLGTVFFLFLGVVTCILMMISFSGSFEVQLAPFFAFILGGGVGLYASLGARNPSAAMGLASLVVPFATFYAVVSFVLDHSGLTFLVTSAAYGFSVAAMLIPALHEFDFAMGRTTGEEE